MRLFFEEIFRFPYKLITSSQYRKFLRFLLTKSGQKRFSTGKTSFNNLKLMYPDGRSFTFQYKEIFLENIYNFHTEKENPVILDCGANIGLSSIYFKQKYPGAIITAFEADPAIFEYLTLNLAENGFTDIQTVNKAVWINNNEIEIASEGADGASVFGDGNKIKVPAARLKEVIEKHCEIDFLKIDVEGAETEIIKDIADSLGNVRNIFIEYHSFIKMQQSLGKILEILEMNGFRYYICNEMIRKEPFINKTKNSSEFDTQLNIFAYK